LVTWLLFQFQFGYVVVIPISIYFVVFFQFQFISWFSSNFNLFRGFLPISIFIFFSVFFLVFAIFLFIFYFLFYNYDSKIIDKLIELAKIKKIPLKFRDYKLRGTNEKPIDNFIDSIESI